jgi:hypothetical protein
MTTEVTPNPQDKQDKQDKQITVDVPQERVGEFYAWFGRFLSGRPGPRHGRGPRGRHGRRCGGRHDVPETQDQVTTPTPTTSL